MKTIILPLTYDHQTSLWMLNADSLAVDHRRLRNSRYEFRICSALSFAKLVASSYIEEVEFEVLPLVETWYPVMEFRYCAPRSLACFYWGWCSYENARAQRAWDSDPDNDAYIRLSVSADKGSWNHFLRGNSFHSGSAVVTHYTEARYMTALQLLEKAIEAENALLELFK